MMPAELVGLSNFLDLQVPTYLGKVRKAGSPLPDGSFLTEKPPTRFPSWS